MSDMIQCGQEPESIASAILQILRANPGEYMSPYNISRKIGQGQASTRQTLAELACRGAIRSYGARSSTSYYIPTATQIAAEARGLESKWKPLSPRLEHRAKIAEIRALRDAIPSLY